MIVRKPLELPPAVARNFAKDMRVYFAELNATKRGEVAARRPRAVDHA
jgi:hypothetical protein